MASIFWNDLNNGDVIDIDAVGFDPAIDRIIISNDAMHLGGWTWTGENNTDFYMSITYNGVTKAVTFAGLAAREFAADTLYFSNGDKFLVGDMLATTDGDDDANIITGGAGRDVLSGLGGNDSLFGGDGDDRLLGYSGNDLIDGGGGFDQAMYSSKVTDPVNASLTTGHGYQSGYVDTYLNIEGLRGSAGKDFLVGDNASNYLGGGDGDDWLVGEAGKDTLAGDLIGSGIFGNDVFEFGAGDSLRTSFDIIQDFGVGDKIVFRWMSGVDLNANDHTYVWQGDINTTINHINDPVNNNPDNVAYFFTNGTNGWLYIKGSGSGDQFNDTLIQLNGRTTALTASDFLNTNGSQTIMSQHETAADVDNSGDLFGASVSGTSDWAVIGAPGDDGAGDNAGTVYLYQFQGNQRVLRDTLTAADASAGDGFGGAVAMREDLLVVGAENDDVGGNNDSGSATIFRYNFMKDAWMQEASLGFASAAAGDHLGAAVAIDGEWAAVATDATDSNHQGVVLYHYEGGSWLQNTFIAASSLGYTDGGEFGCAIAMDAGMLVIGAAGDDTNGQNAGAAYVYRYNEGTGIWQQEAKLTDPAGDGNDLFGTAVAASNTFFAQDYIAVGAPGDDTGSVSVFHFNGTVWLRETTLTPSLGQTGDQFGISLSMDDEAEFTVGTVNSSMGIGAYFYDHDWAGHWWEEDWVPVPGGMPANGPVMIGKGANSLILGVSGDQTTGANAGAAYFYWDEEGARSTTSDDFLMGDDEADTLNGLEGNDLLFGRNNNDTLNGGDGNDLLNGGWGADSMTGGLGDDIYIVDDAGDTVNEETGAGIDTVIASITCTLADKPNIENLRLAGTDAINGSGNGLANILTGNRGSNTLNGGLGADTMIGGLGNDTYYVDNALDVTTEQADPGSGIDTVFASLNWTLAANVENLTLTGAALTGTGNALDNTLTGNAGANTLNGLAGNDILYGLEGNDILNGAGGNDFLNGGAGADTMTGGLGDDTYYVDNAGDITTELSGAGYGVDTVIASLDWTLGNAIENLLLDSDTAINGTGNAINNTLMGTNAANILSGLDGNDRLEGLGGNDTLYGGSGTDILDGGTGADILAGGSGNDTYYVDNAGDLVNEGSTLPTEIDSVFASVNWTLRANQENLTLIGGATNGTGNILANVITGNNLANTLTGAAGDDILNGGEGNDILNGGLGLDTMIGGSGNDTYYVDTPGEVVTETNTATTEIDKVMSSVTWTLGANVEKLTLTGTEVINGTGNELNNTINGNSANNVLRGEAGGDILNGGLGNDRLIGGSGSDFFVFNSALNAATNTDTIVNMDVMADGIRLSSTVFTQLSLGTLAGSQFRSSSTGQAADANDYILYNTSTGALLYDADGNGAGVATHFATLDTKPGLTAANIIVVA